MVEARSVDVKNTHTHLNPIPTKYYCTVYITLLYYYYYEYISNNTEFFSIFVQLGLLPLS